MSEAHCGTKEDFDRHNQSIGSFAQAAAAGVAHGAYELVPTEFEPSTLFVGFAMHGTLSRRADGKFTFTPDTIPLGKIVLYGDPPGRVTNVSGWGKFGIDPKVEQEQMRAEQERYAYEHGKAKCLANPNEYGVGIILADGTWLSHEEAVSTSREKPSVNYRNVAGPGEIPFQVAERGVITRLELMGEDERAALMAYVCRAAPDVDRTGMPDSIVTAHSHNPDGSESMSIEFIGAKWDVSVKDANGQEQTYLFADPKFVGKNVTVVDETTYVVGASNSGIENHVSGMAYVDDLVAVPPLDPHKLLDAGIKQLLENAGIPKGVEMACPPREPAPDLPFGTLGGEYLRGRPLPPAPAVPLTPEQQAAVDEEMQLFLHPDADGEALIAREKDFYKRIIPPLKITNDELDRSVPTDLPVDATKDNHYQAWRRHNDLPGTYAVLNVYNSIHTGETEFTKLVRRNGVVDVHASVAAENYRQVQLKEALNRKPTDHAYWKQFMDPALGVPHVERVEQDDDCGAVIVTEKKDAPGTDAT